MSEDKTTTIHARGDAAAPADDASGGAGQRWQQGGTAIVMVASVIAYGVMASGCAGV